MSVIKWSLLVYLVFAINLVFGSELARSDVLPDPILVLAILVIVSVDHSLAFALAAAIGLFGDLLWGVRLGSSMLCLAVVGYSLGGIRHWFETESLTRSISVAWFLGTIVLFGRAVLNLLLDGGSVDLERLLVRAAWEGFWCGIAVYVTHFTLDRCRERFSLIFHTAP